MAIIKAVSSHAPISIAIDYVEKKEKTEARLLSGIGVSPETAKDEMEATKELYGKTGGRTYKHFVQSFAPGENITPEEAHEMANEFASKVDVFKGFEVLIATHQDREHIHTHFIVNSVSYEDGHKFQMAAKDLQSMKDLSDSLCKEKGLSICEKGKTFEGEERTGIVAWTKEKYQFLQKMFEEKSSKSYVTDIANAAKDCIAKATSKDEFCSFMHAKGYDVDWQDRHKHITFKDADGHKVRDTNLNKTFNLGIDKDTLEERFKYNAASPELDKISKFAANAIASQYKITEYQETKDALDEKLAAREVRVKATADKQNATIKAITAAKSEIKDLQIQRENCSSLQFVKRHEIEEKIEHVKTLIETIKADRDAFLERYGFSSVDELKDYADDYAKAKDASEKLDNRLDNEKESRNDNIDSIKALRKDDSDIVVKEEDILKAQEGLVDEFGDLNMEKFDSSCRQVLDHLKSDDSDKDIDEKHSVIEQLENNKKKLDESNIDEDEISHHDRGIGR